MLLVFHVTKKLKLLVVLDEVTGDYEYLENVTAVHLVLVEFSANRPILLGLEPHLEHLGSQKLFCMKSQTSIGTVSPEM